MLTTTRFLISSPVIVSLVRQVPIRRGSIVLFRGANTLHRVTRTGGSSFRILSPLHYEQTPGRIYAD